MQRKLNDKRKQLSMIHMRHRALRRRPQQQSIPTTPPSTGPNYQESEPSTGSRPRHCVHQGPQGMFR
jgi:hypothetical protein